MRAIVARLAAASAGAQNGANGAAKTGEDIIVIAASVDAAAILSLKLMSFLPGLPTKSCADSSGAYIG